MNALQTLYKEGYVVWYRSMPSRNWFNKLFKAMEELMTKLSDEMSEEWRSAAFEWLAEGNNDSYFCGVPAAFRDRAGTEGKRNKAYLQWILEFYRSSQFAATQVSKLSEIRVLTEGLTDLQDRCTEQLVPVMAELANYPNFGERYDPARPLPLVFKLVRYNYSPKRFATDPHFDKSGLSMILHADDANVMWRIGKGNPCRLSKMFAPFDYPANADEPNHAILFPGLFLQEANRDLPPPSPHFVLPVESRTYRYSILAFLVVPHIDGTNLNTTAPIIHDDLYEVT